MREPWYPGPPTPLLFSFRVGAMMEPSTGMLSQMGECYLINYWQNPHTSLHDSAKKQICKVWLGLEAKTRDFFLQLI